MRQEVGIPQGRHVNKGGRVDIRHDQSDKLFSVITASIGASTAHSGAQHGSSESREDAASERPKVHAIRLYDKLDQLEKRWQSQKTHQFTEDRTMPDHSSISHGRDQPEPDIQAIAQIDAAFENQKVQKTRVVSMFDKLYQKGRTKGITRRRHAIAQSPSRPNIKRQKRRQDSALTIQRHFRGMRVRRYIQHQVVAASTIQEWWELIAYRLNYLKFLNMVMVLQSWARLRQVMKCRRQKQGAAVLIQSLWRERDARNRLCIAENSARLIQKFWSSYLSRAKQRVEPMRPQSKNQPESTTTTSLYRAAQFRRSKVRRPPVAPSKHSEHGKGQDRVNLKGTGVRSLSPSARMLTNIVCRPACAYLPGCQDRTDTRLRFKNFLLGGFDEEMIGKLTVIQKWTRVQLRKKIIRCSCRKIQNCWRIYKSQAHLVSDFLLKEW